MSAASAHTCAMDSGKPSTAPLPASLQRVGVAPRPARIAPAARGPESRLCKGEAASHRDPRPLPAGWARHQLSRRPGSSASGQGQELDTADLAGQAGLPLPIPSVPQPPSSPSSLPPPSLLLSPSSSLPLPLLTPLFPSLLSSSSGLCAPPSSPLLCPPAPPSPDPQFCAQRRVGVTAGQKQAELLSTVLSMCPGPALGLP